MSLCFYYQLPWHISSVTLFQPICIHAGIIAAFIPYSSFSSPFFSPFLPDHMIKAVINNKTAPLGLTVTGHDVALSDLIQTDHLLEKPTNQAGHKQRDIYIPIPFRYYCISRLYRAELRALMGYVLRRTLCTTRPATKPTEKKKKKHWLKIFSPSPFFGKPQHFLRNRVRMRLRACSQLG